MTVISAPVMSTPAVSQVSQVVVGHANMKAGEVSTLNINEYTVSYTSVGTSALEVANGLVSAINTGTLGNYSAVYSAPSGANELILITAATPNVSFTCSGSVT